jgi:hypothetical protein
MNDPFFDPCCMDLVIRQDPQPIVISQPQISNVIEGPDIIPPAPPPDPTVSYVLLGPGSWQTNQPFRLISGIAMAITAIDSAEPWCDGITLESGQEGQSVHAVIIPGRYETPLALPGMNGDFLWMDTTAKAATNQTPSPSAGFTWALQVARKISLREMLFSPAFPIRMAL